MTLIQSPVLENILDNIILPGLERGHSPPPREPSRAGSRRRRRGGACGAAPRRVAAREVEPAQERSHQRWCACSPEARRLCTTAELWQDQRKAEVRSRDGESPVGDAPRQECGAGADRNRRAGRQQAGILIYESWRPGVPLPCSSERKQIIIRFYWLLVRGIRKNANAQTCAYGARVRNGYVGLSLLHRKHWFKQ